MTPGLVKFGGFVGVCLLIAMAFNAQPIPLAAVINYTEIFIIVVVSAFFAYRLYVKVNQK